MSQIERNMFFLAVIILIICGVSKAAVYEVGDSKGWTSIGQPDYKSWSASKHFHVGDTIVFKYRNEFHDVLRVTHKNYKTCNTTTYYGTPWTSGNDSFTIQKPGHYFFVCSFPTHCEAGQKVDIRVPPTPGPRAPPPQSPPTPPTSGAAPTQSPKSSTPAMPPAQLLPPSPSPEPSHKSSGATHSWSKKHLIFVVASVSLFLYLVQ